MLRGYRMLDDWDALVLIDESYEAQAIVLMDNLYIPLLCMFFGFSAMKTKQFQ